MCYSRLLPAWLAVLGSCATLGRADEPADRVRRPHVVMLVNENEYGAEKTLPAFAQRLAEHYGCRCTVARGRDPEGLAGLDSLKTADVAVLFVRRLPLPKEQFDKIRAYLDSGGPLVALRTASHAFSVRGEPPVGAQQWPSFDRDVLGGNYHDHAKGNTKVWIAPGAADDPILAGVGPSPWISNGTLYYTSPVDPRAKILLMASAQGKTEPAAWTRMYGKSRVFYTSLGHADDFTTPQFRRLVLNAIFWAMDRPPPTLSNEHGKQDYR
jgi:type 1 glutamine amidotransferase